MSSDHIGNCFEEIHNGGKWINKDPDRETSCGLGSKIKNNTELIKVLPTLIKKYGIKEVIDIGCGDLNWIKMLFSFFAENQMQYVGYDVSQTIINKANENIGAYFDYVSLKIGSIEKLNTDYDRRLVVCKDVLVHLPNNIVLSTLAECSSRTNLLLTTNFATNGNNRDIEIGGWRPISLAEEPFNLPKPIEVISNVDHSTQNIFPDKSMSLFKI